MRCPHCAGEIPAGARFCGICGRGITPPVEGSRGAPPAPARWSAAQPVGPEALDSVSLFELPTSRAGRRARMALILTLDAILAGAGLVMILSYAESRRQAATAAPGAALPGKVEAPSPAQASDPAPSLVEPPRPAIDFEPKSAPPPPEPKRPPARTPKSKPAAGLKPTSAPAPRSDRRVDRGPAADEVAVDAPFPAPGEESADLSSSSEIELEQASATQPPAGEDAETERLRGVVDGHRADLESCYLEAARADGSGAPLAGRIDIRFTLMSDGTPVGVAATGNTTGSPALAGCVAELVRGWHFPPSSAPLELEWPFLFRPPADSTDR